MTHQFLYDYQTIVTLSRPIASHFITLRCKPCKNIFQRLDFDNFIYSPIFHINYDIDAFGNQIIYGGTRETHDTLAYISSGIVSVDDYIIPEREINHIYKSPSTLSVPSEAMKKLHFTNKNIYERALEICHYVHEIMIYTPGITNNQTTAAEAFDLRRGVCQDYAHIMLSLCRNNNIAARYVNGLLEGYGYTHAWVEIHDGKAWIPFDPTNNRPIEYGCLKIAHGRDVADCPVNRGTFIGCSNQNTWISVTVKKL